MTPDRPPLVTPFRGGGRRPVRERLAEIRANVEAVLAKWRRDPPGGPGVTP